MFLITQARNNLRANYFSLVSFAGAQEKRVFFMSAPCLFRFTPLKLNPERERKELKYSEEITGEKPG